MALEGVEDIYPLTSTQAGMVYHTIASPNSAVYVGQVSYLIEGPLAPDQMAETWRILVQRHASLRYSVLWDDLDQPLQIVHEKVTVPWSVLDWRELSAKEQEQALANWKARDLTESFDFAKPPLMRLTLVRLAEERYQLVWTSHHSVADGWSAQILLKEMRDIYSAAVQSISNELPEPFPYRRFIAWLQSQDLSQAEIYWRSYLKGFEEPTRLRVACPEAPRGDIASREFARLGLGPELSKRLNEAAASYRVSLYTLMQCAWGMLLHRYSGRDDVVFGVTTSGRPAGLDGVEEAVGLFINTLPVRHTFSGDTDMGDWLERLRVDSLELLRHQHTPLSKVKAWSDVGAGRSLFDTILVLENYPHENRQRSSQGGCSISLMEMIDHSNYALSLMVLPGIDTALKLEYDTRAYDANTAGHLLEDVRLILEQIADGKVDRVADITLYREEEKLRLLKDYCSGETLRESSVNVVDQMLARAADSAECTAVSCGEESLTYGQLGAAAAKLADHLKSLGVGAGSRVALCLDNGVAAIAALFGILRSGAAYIPIDPAYPTQRVRYMLADADCELIVSAEAVSAGLGDIGVPVYCTDSDRLIGGGETTPAKERNPDCAYIIYTSGSTGKPKGVAVSHANLAWSTLARRQYYRGVPDSFLLLSSLSFDSSVAGVFWTLCGGGHLVIAPKRIEQDMAQLSQLIADHSVTHTLLLPSLYRAMLSHADISGLQSLRCVILAGESLAPQVLQEHRALLPWAVLFNEYGPTEGTVWCSAFDTTQWRGAGSVPIGRPVPGACVYLLDGEARLAPRYAIGEICVGGPGVALGYLNRADETVEKFVSDPFSATESMRLYRTGDLGRYDGDRNIEFLGRADQQTKLRGFRIELAEVEAALLEHAVVGQAAALLIEETTGPAPVALDEGELLRLEARLLEVAPEERESLLREVESGSKEDTLNRLGADA